MSSAHAEKSTTVRSLGTRVAAARVAVPLLDAGCSIVAFDAPAHGTSGGRLASVPLFAEAVAAVARASGARAAIGHSMGAAALALAVSRGLALDAAVLVAPPRAPDLFFERFCAALG